MPPEAAQSPVETSLAADQKAAFGVISLTTAYVLARTLHVIAELGVADALDEEPQPAAALARTVGAHPQALHRMLRLLASHGIFEVRDGRFAHTAESRILRDDHPESLRPLVRLFALPPFWQSFGRLEHCARTGLPALEEVAPGGLFEYLADQPEQRRIFDAAMQAKSHREIRAVLAAYDFSRFGTIVDIGGGHGHLLRAVLEAAPDAQGVLFDLPHVVADAAVNTQDRMAFEGGDFFHDALPPADAYLLMDVLHDWDDERAARILANVRRAAQPDATLLVIESIITDDPGPSWAKTLDINMLANTGGRERTRDEYKAMFHGTGFRLDRVIPTVVAAIVEGAAQPTE